MIFFPMVCLIYYLIPFRVRHIFLLAASYYFYMCWNPQYALLMLTSTVITYLSGLLIGRARKKRNKRAGQLQMKFYVALSFILNLSILFFFKYFNFAVDSLNVLMSHLNMAPISSRFDILLPVGISFYTFQALSYTVDVYRGDIYCEKDFLKYALFVSFFPQLVAGPIERSKNLLKQIHVKHSWEWDRIRYGLTQMLFGYFQKVVISDNAAIVVDRVYNDYKNFGAVELILATLLFAIQIYCDFGGYSNIAIGAARVMGFDLMENFNTPYLSVSIADFWRRWHISLSTWFRDYLYIPLGGNRKGKFRKYLNLMIVFFVSGLWHGASWHYVVWGCINGLYQVIGDLLKPVRNVICYVFSVNRKSFSHRFGKGLITFFLVNVSWIFFRANTVGDAFSIMNRIANNWNPWNLFNEALFELGLSSKQFYMLWMAILVLLITDILTYLKVDFLKGICRQGMWLRFTVYLLLIFWILLCGSYGPGYDAGQFIYFQF